MFQNLWRELSYVKRWGIFRRNKEQSVAEHSYYVAVYAEQVADLVKWQGDRGMLLNCALIHDLFEGRSGDIPAPFKRQMQMDEPYLEAEWEYFRSNFPDRLEALAALRGDPQIAGIVRVADRLEGCLFLATECMSGNRYAGQWDDAGSPANDMFRSLGQAWEKLRDEVMVDQPIDVFAIMHRAIMTTENHLPNILLAYPGLRLVAE